MSKPQQAYIRCPDCNESFLIPSIPRGGGVPDSCICFECTATFQLTEDSHTLPQYELIGPTEVVDVLNPKIDSRNEELDSYLLVELILTGRFKGDVYLRFMSAKMANQIPYALLEKLYTPTIGICFYPEDSDGSTLEGSEGCVLATSAFHVIRSEDYQRLNKELARWKGTNVTNIFFMKPKEGKLDAAFEFAVSPIENFHEKPWLKNAIVAIMKEHCPKIATHDLENYYDRRVAKHITMLAKTEQS